MRRLTVWFTSAVLLSTCSNCSSLKFTQENRTTEAVLGETASFEWRYKLSTSEQGRRVTVTFGLWEDWRIAINLLVVESDDQGNTTKVIEVPLDKHSNRSFWKRIVWVGNLKESHVAFQLTNVTKADAKTFGCKVRVEVHGQPREGSTFTTLRVLDPPPTTAPPQQVKADLVLREGERLKVECPRKNYRSSTFIWSKDGKEIRRGSNSTFVIQNVRRENSGNYTCLVQFGLGNWTGAEIRLDVEYPPTILLDSKRKTIYSPKNRTLLLPCPAVGNPPPKHAWYLTAERITANDIVRSEEQVLKVVLRDDSDFSIYTCKVTNKLGSDLAEYIIRKVDTNENKPPKHDDNSPNTQERDSAEDDGGKMAMYLSIAAVLAVLLIGGIIVLRFVARRCKQEELQEDDSGSPLSLDILETAANKQLLSQENAKDDWGLLSKNVKIQKIIGRGAFGVVSRGYVLDLPGKPGWTLVAIKSTQEDASEKERKDLLSELQVLKQIKPHPHVIRLYGCITDSEVPMVVVEYVPHGDLLGYLRKSRGVHDVYYDDPDIQPSTNLTSQQLVTFAWEIADGMDYLSSNKIIHRDLAARNVLVGDGETCKITDFGMARDVQEEDVYQRTTESRLPVKWTAPEALFGTGEYTTQSDVWSFGIVLYEICTIGGKPYPGLTMRDMPAMLSTGYRMPRPPHVDEELYALMRSCWEDIPICRPTFEYLRLELDKLKNEMFREYINLRECVYENETSMLLHQTQLTVSLPPERSAFVPCQRYTNA